jgi:hypothetical protein
MHTEELHGLYSPRNVVRLLKPAMNLAGKAALMEDSKNVNSLGGDTFRTQTA